MSKGLVALLVTLGALIGVALGSGGKQGKSQSPTSSQALERPSYARGWEVAVWVDGEFVPRVICRDPQLDHVQKRVQCFRRHYSE